MDGGLGALSPSRPLRSVSEARIPRRCCLGAAAFAVSSCPVGSRSIWSSINCHTFFLFLLLLLLLLLLLPDFPERRSTAAFTCFLALGFTISCSSSLSLSSPSLAASWMDFDEEEEDDVAGREGTTCSCDLSLVEEADESTGAFSIACIFFSLRC